MGCYSRWGDMVCLCGLFASMVVGGIAGGDEVVTFPLGSLLPLLLWKDSGWYFCALLLLLVAVRNNEDGSFQLYGRGLLALIVTGRRWLVPGYIS